MIELSIVDRAGKTRQLSFEKDEILIGRVDSNDLVLAKSNVSKRHSKILVREERLLVIDLKSTNGTFVNGKKITGPQPIRAGDTVHVGEFVIEASYQASLAPMEDSRSEELEPENAIQALEDDAVAEDDSSDQWSTRPVPAIPQELDSRDEVLEVVRQEQEPSSAALSAPRQESGSPSPEALALATLQQEVHARLRASGGLEEGGGAAELAGETRRARTSEAAQRVLQQMALDGTLPSQFDRGRLLEAVLDEAVGLGPLGDLLRDEAVSDILVNHAGQVYVERAGQRAYTGKIFSSNEVLLEVVARMLAPVGGKLDVTSPVVSVRLEDGVRLEAILPPLSLKGPSLAIRKGRRAPLTLPELLTSKALSVQMGECLEMGVRARRGILISGAVGSGKTTLLNLIANFIPAGERIVSLEDAAELRLHQNHWVQLEARPGNAEGGEEAALSRLLKSALRIRPDRIVLDECRGAETPELLQAMNAGHDGALATVAAGSPRQALARLERLAIQHGLALPAKAIRELIAGAFSLVVQQERSPAGTRHIVAIVEIAGLDGDGLVLRDLFTFQREPADRDGKGHFVTTGAVPKFCEEMQHRGMPVNLKTFREEG